MALVFDNVKERSVAKYYHLMSLFSDFGKTFEELGLLITTGNVILFPVSTIKSAFLFQCRSFDNCS